MKKVKTGIIGCGNISDIYLHNCTSVFSEILEVAAVADLIYERAADKAQKYNIAKACSVEQMLADSEIEIIVNLTVPQAHASINLKAIEAGKSVYVEKPFALTREDGITAIEAARQNGVLCGGAPDTFLGAALQTCRKLIDDGGIGVPIGATAFMTCRGHESWHPSPEFYYKKGGGPMFDMGPYYLTALVSLIGPVASVCGIARKTFPSRTITSQPLCGKTIDVEVDTHIAGLLNFENGAVGTIITSFDVWGANLPYIEIYGSEGSLSVPDPNWFGGQVRIKRRDKEWEEVPLINGYSENSRGLGVVDMAVALRTGRKPRANYDIAYHVLDIMQAIHDLSAAKTHIKLNSACTVPDALPGRITWE